MFQSLLKDILTRKAELKTLRKQLTTKLKDDQQLQTFTQDVKEAAEVRNSYRDSLIHKDAVLSDIANRISGIKAELKALNEQLMASVLPAVKDESGQLSLFDQPGVNITIQIK